MHTHIVMTVKQFIRQISPGNPVSLGPGGMEKFDENTNCKRQYRHCRIATSSL